MLPTKTGPKGIDIGFLTDDDTLELIEVKAGGEPRVFKPRPSSRKPPRGKQRIEVPTGEGEASRFVTSRQNVAADIATGKAVLIQEGKVVQNQLSAITENLRKNIVKMFEVMEVAVKAKKLDPKVVERVRDIIGNRGGTLRFVIDIEKGATMSDEQRDAADLLIRAAFNDLMKGLGAIKTKLEILYRKS